MLVHKILSSLLLPAVALAADTADITWRLERASGQASVTVSRGGANATEVCGNVHGDIDFSNVDHYGRGYFLVGPNNYTTKVDGSANSYCVRMYDQDALQVICSDVPGVSHNAAYANASSSLGCFQSPQSHKRFATFQAHHDARNTASWPSLEMVSPPAASEDDAAGVAEDDSLDKRQNICPIYTMYSNLGDGNPHQNYFHKQLSQNMECPPAGCQIEYTETKSYTIGFSVSATGTGKWSFFGGGFDVSESWETGLGYQCQGEEGETICSWQKVAHTAYTVQLCKEGACGAMEKTCDADNTAIYRSPNAKNRGGAFYCVIGTCRAQGDGYWESFENAPAGVA